MGLGFTNTSKPNDGGGEAATGGGTAGMVFWRRPWCMGRKEKVAVVPVAAGVAVSTTIIVIIVIMVIMVIIVIIVLMHMPITITLISNVVIVF